jgi:hypothetical protein
VGGAGAVVRLGIYADTGNGAPGTLILDAGTISGTAVATSAITISQTLTPGLYWLAAVSQVAACTMSQLTTTYTGFGTLTTAAAVSSPAPTGYTSASITGALPTPFVATDTITTPTLVVLRAA